MTAPPPGYGGEVPYGIGVVELPEGIRVIGRLTESDPAALAVGPADGAPGGTAPSDDDGNDVVTYAFAPVGARERSVRHRTGVGMHPFGRFDGVTTTDMGVVAVRSALREAGVGKGGFQAAFCGTAYGGVATGHKVLSRLGMTGMPIVDVEAGCASGGAALMLAAAAIRAGQYDTVLVFGTEKMPKGIIRSSFFEPWQEEAGLAATPSFFALRAQRLSTTSGVTKDHLAGVVVKNRRHGAANPDAMYQKEISVEEVLASRLVCEPLHLFMLCSPNEGAAALVLRRPTWRRRPGAVTLAAAVLRSHLPGPVLSESTPLAGLADDTVPTPTTLAATAAYEEAGLGPDDLDVVECQDTDAARELLLLRGARPVRARRFGRAARLGRHRSWAAASRSTRAAGCSPRASRSAPPPWARWSSWCASSGASAARARSTGPGPRSPTRSGAGPTPAWSSSPAESAVARRRGAADAGPLAVGRMT